MLRPSRRPRRRTTASAAVLLGALVLGACGTGDDADDTGDTADTTAPGSTDAPAGDGDDTADGTAETSDELDPAPAEPADEPAAATTLAPDPAADLPTARPEDMTTITTLPGPLPVPSIQLIEESRHDQPIDLAVRPGDDRLMIVEKGGRIIAADADESIVVLDMAAVGDAAGVSFRADGGEQGLLGVAYHPERPLVYVHFTGGSGDTVVGELSIDATTAEADPGSYRELLREQQPFGNHNGGELEFGPDGHLYLALGDGGAADDPERASLDLTSRLGSILRFDPAPTGGQPITVPDDNPYAGSSQAGDPDPLIWSSGLRNPWKFSFDALTGDLWIADVGQGDFEEINRASADPTTGTGAGRGLDFGWSAFEAYAPFNDDQSSPGHTPPVAAYEHVDGNCSVSGGAVARDSSYADLNGWYVYGDFCSGRLWALDTTSIPDEPGPDRQPTIVEVGSVPALTSVAEGPAGDLYAVSLTGTVFRLAPA